MGQMIAYLRFNGIAPDFCQIVDFQLLKKFLNVFLELSLVHNSSVR
jgi:hypothetical protein